MSLRVEAQFKGKKRLKCVTRQWHRVEVGKNTTTLSIVPQGRGALPVRAVSCAIPSLYKLEGKYRLLLFYST